MPKEKKLTAKQQKFVDCYDGVGVKAVRAAGYAGSDGTLRAVASQLLTKPNIKAAIAARNVGPQAQRILTRVELQAYWTRMALNPLVKDSDKLKATELLGRSDCLFADKIVLDAKVSLEKLLESAAEPPAPPAPAPLSLPLPLQPEPASPS